MIIAELKILMRDELLFGDRSPLEINLKKLPAERLHDTNTPSGYWVGQELCESDEGGYCFMVDFASKIAGEKALFRTDAAGCDWVSSMVSTYSIPNQCWNAS